MLKSCLFTLLFLPLISTGFAQTSRVLSFSQWKAQQVADAQNKVARISNRLTLIKSDAAQKQSIKQLESELQSATQNLEIAKDFTIDHYVATYLNQYADSREALLEISNVTPKEEMADLLAAILKARPAPITAVQKPGATTF